MISHVYQLSQYHTPLYIILKLSSPENALATSIIYPCAYILVTHWKKKLKEPWNSRYFKVGWNAKDWFMVPHVYIDLYSCKPTQHSQGHCKINSCVTVCMYCQKSRRKSCKKKSRRKNTWTFLGGGAEMWDLSESNKEPVQTPPTLSHTMNHHSKTYLIEGQFYTTPYHKTHQTHLVWLKCP